MTCTLKHGISDYAFGEETACFAHAGSDFHRSLWDGISDAVLVFERTMEKPHYMNAATRNMLGGGSSIQAAVQLCEGGFFHDLMAEGAALDQAEATGSATFRTHPAFGGKRLNGRVMSTLNEQGELYFVAMFHVETEQESAEFLRKEVNSVITHELRTPLTSIKGALDLMKSGLVGPLSDKAQSLLNIAGANSDRMLSLIQEILDLNESAQAGPKPESEVIGIAGLLEGLVATHQGYGAYHGVDVKMRPTDAALQIRAVPAQVTKILSNLLSNAVKASERDQSVDIWAQQSGSEIAIFVRDHGGGIPAELRDTLFERYTKASWGNDRRVGSSGLGLNIVRTLVEQMDGTISFETQTGEGTTFRINLPAWS
ncbi:sensor histidine kinase [Celeribacter persicus]|uniref:histidine kinase n=1 Tax=Celeribacter persicus TaxID=1651082 RepID=A0A2T5H9W5_9RHOB|nr:HAMP domain-containing sensor histidine kinase [Celeribacter persicus]PTQ68332.1 signal transduction histidine kinase [Celeribacter persicus]